MEFTLEQAGFAFLAAVIVVFSIMTVTTKRILRAATYLLFVLFATAGFYFQLNYSFLGAVQLLIYAGGIIVLYVFSILLTSSDEDKKAPLRNRRMLSGLIVSIVGANGAGKSTLMRCRYVYLFVADALLSSGAVYRRRSRHACHRLCDDGYRKISVSVALRGGQRTVVGMYHWRFVDCS